MKKIVLWFNTIENMILKGKVNGNEYFSTGLIMFAAFVGSLWSEHFMIDAMEIYDGIYGFDIFAIGFVIMALLAVESVIVCDDYASAAVRFGLGAGATMAALIAGMVGSIFITLAVAAWPVLLAVVIIKERTSSAS